MCPHHFSLSFVFVLCQEGFVSAQLSARFSFVLIGNLVSVEDMKDPLKHLHDLRSLL